MEEKNIAEKWVDRAENLIETYRALIAIRMVEKASLGVSFSIVGIIVLQFALCILLIVGLGAASWIGDMMHNRTAGLFIVGGFYLLLLFFMLLLARKVLIPAIRNLVIKKMYDAD
jgi:hypothetical protein